MSLLDKVNEYKQNTFDKDLMASLKDGQQPHTLFITCSDSRISVNELTGSKPGEVFVIRNAGNIIDKYDENNPTKESLTIEYAVKALNVSEIIVCGHVSCGAMGAIKDIEAVGDLKLVQNGLKPIAADYKDKGALESSLDDLISFNVAEQLRKLMSYSYIEDRVSKGQLSMSGWVYDFVNGEIKTVVSVEDAVKGGV